MRPMDNHTLDVLERLAQEALTQPVSKRLADILYATDYKIYQDAEIYTKTNKYTNPFARIDHVDVICYEDSSVVDIDSLDGQWRHDMICAIRNYVWEWWYNTEPDNL